MRVDFQLCWLAFLALCMADIFTNQVQQNESTSPLSLRSVVPLTFVFIVQDLLSSLTLTYLVEKINRSFICIYIIHDQFWSYLRYMLVRENHSQKISTAWIYKKYSLLTATQAVDANCTEKKERPFSQFSTMIARETNELSTAKWMRPPIFFKARRPL